MTSTRQLRKSALAMPGAEAAVDGGATTYRVRGMPFAVALRGDAVLLHLSEGDAEDLLGHHPQGERRGGGVRLALSGLNGMELNHWVRQAWLAHVPAEEAAAASAVDEVVAGEVGDLPRALGTPATRALVGDGLDSLDAVAGRSREEVAALHGVGPRAVRLLEDALAGRGLSFRG